MPINIFPKNKPINQQVNGNVLCIPASGTGTGRLMIFVIYIKIRENAQKIVHDCTIFTALLKKINNATPAIRTKLEENGLYLSVFYHARSL